MGGISEMVGGGVSGASAGSAAGPWGALIGGIAGIGLGGLMPRKKDPGLPFQTEANRIGMQLRDEIGRNVGPYTGERVAQLDDNELRAYNLSREPGQSAPLYERMQSEYLKGPRMLEGYDLSGYTNPYLEQVLNPARDQLNRGYVKNRMAARDRYRRAGAFGGSRQAIGEVESERAYNDALSALEGTQRYNAWKEAQGSFYADNAARERNLTGMGALAGALDTRGQQQLGNLMATGGLARGIRQAGMDTGYADYLDQRDYPITRLQNLSNVLGTLRSSQPAPAQTPDRQTQLFGGMQALGGLLGQGGAFSGLFGGGNAGAGLNSNSGFNLGTGSGSVAGNLGSPFPDYSAGRPIY